MIKKISFFESKTKFILYKIQVHYAIVSRSIQVEYRTVGTS